MLDDLPVVVAEHFGVPPERVTDSARFVEDLGADSLEMIDLIFALETKYQIVLDSDEETPATFGELSRLLQIKAQQIREH